MAPANHNRVIGILHLVYGGLSVLMMIVMSAFFGVFGFMAANEKDALPMVFMVIVLAFMFVMYVILAVPSLLAGYALLKRKKWAKIVGIVAGIIAAMSFPFGTALCVYTLWFLFGEKGRELYEKAAYALPPPPPVWNNQASMEREHEYLPSTPPDWR